VCIDVAFVQRPCIRRAIDFPMNERAKTIDHSALIWTNIEQPTTDN
jgi:hypothetical protein